MTNRESLAITAGVQVRVGARCPVRGGSFGVERRRDAGRLAALDVAAHRGEPGGEPADHVEAVQHAGGVAQVSVDGGLVGHRAVGDDDLHAGAPAVALGGEEPAQRLSGPWGTIANSSPPSPETMTVT